MAHFDFIAGKTDAETITFGNDDKQVTIDITFIPSMIGFEIKRKVQEVKDGIYTPQLFADIICLFTQEVTADWIIANCEYGVLDQIVAKILQRAFGRTAKAKN